MKLAGSAAFTITGDSCHSLGPDKACTVTVRFAPARAGTVTATLTAASKKHLVTAAGVLAGSERALGAGPGLAFTPAVYDSGTLFTGKTASQTLTLTNSGGAADTSHLYWTDLGDGTIWEVTRRRERRSPAGSGPR